MAQEYGDKMMLGMRPMARRKPMTEMNTDIYLTKALALLEEMTPEQLSSLAEAVASKLEEQEPAEETPMEDTAAEETAEETETEE